MGNIGNKIDLDSELRFLDVWVVDRRSTWGSWKGCLMVCLRFLPIFPTCSLRVFLHWLRNLFVIYCLVNCIRRMAVVSHVVLNNLDSLCTSLVVLISRNSSEETDSQTVHIRYLFRR